MGTQIRDLGQAIGSTPRSRRDASQDDRGPLNPNVIGRAAYVRPHQPTMEELDAARIDAQATHISRQTRNSRDSYSRRQKKSREVESQSSAAGGEYGSQDSSPEAMENL